ncbi:MFS transporter [Frateuria aurantia]
MPRLPDSSGTTCRNGVLLLAACLSGLLIPLCFTGPAVVLPFISRELGGTAMQLSWVVNSYILTYGSAMMAAGSLADAYGRKRVWMIGLVLFALVTLMIPLASTAGWVDALRLVQGLGGAAAFAGAMSSLAQTFHGAIRARVFSLLGMTFGLGLAFGPLAAAWLVAVAGWRWVFLATAWIAVLGLALVWAGAQESREPQRYRLDWPGAVSFTAALVLLTYGILLAPEDGWASPGVIAAVMTSGLLFAAFVGIERRQARPMLDLGLFREARFVGVQVLAASPAFFFVTLIVMLPGRFMGIDGMGPLEAGRMMIALAAPLLVVPILAAVLTRWFSPAGLSGIGLLLVAAGLTWLGQVLAGGAKGTLMLPLALIGVGIGLPWGLMDGMAVSVVENERAGMATGIFNCVRVSADGIAIAVVTALLASLIQSGLLHGHHTTGSAAVIEAANRLALGDLRRAEVLLPGERAWQLAIYEQAFRQLLYMLAVASALTAILVFLLLGRARSGEGDGRHAE